MRSVVAVMVCLFALAGCGGGDGGGTTPPPTSNNPPPPPPPAPPPPVIGTTGGTITDTSGAAVIFPAGAVATGTTFRIAVDSTGAPPVPADFGATGSIYMVTPHGGDFAAPVEVRIPVPSVTLQSTQALKIAKAEPGGEWIVLDDTKVVDGKLSTQVRSFSYFIPVVVRYPLPIVSSDPLAFTTTLTCDGHDCTDLFGSVQATFTATGNNGQIPYGCTAADSLSIASSMSPAAPITRVGGSTTFTATHTGQSWNFVEVIYRCAGNRNYSYAGKQLLWLGVIELPRLVMHRMPAQLDVVEGLSANLDAMISGTQFNHGPGFWTVIAPVATDRAVIDWQRSDDGGTSWRVIAQSFQDEANPLPDGAGVPWRPWGVRHSFVATATDQGALIRARACYAASCVTGSTTRINVLQQSRLPAIVDQPRSVLIRTAETANFSVAVSGLPAPTLQWQSRPGNAGGDWTNVSVGTGATTANYTTATRLPSHNGEQYRVVATNALGSVASALATVSVSDLDVAPSIATQPASLSVTSGNDAVFAVAAHGTEALSYQWRFNGAAIGGANSPVLRLSGVTVANAGSYTVAVSNNAGNASSNAAVLTVSAGAPAAVAPSIVTQPVSVTARAGSTATFAVGVDGTGPFSFQWRRNGANITGATSAVLTFNAVALPNAGTFSVAVSNSAGSVTSSNAVLDVSADTTPTAPTITSQPSTLIVPYRGSGVVAVGATGSGPLAYQWSKDGAELPGATLPVLDFRIVAEQDVGTYTVTVSNSMGSVVSRAVDIILLDAPVITQQPLSVTANEGENAIFYVAASSSGLRYQWSMNGSPLPGRIGNTLNVGPLVAGNSGAVYSVAVYNGAGMVYSEGAVLTVQILVAPTITQHPQNVTIEPGQEARMCVTIGGTPTFDLQLQRWDGSAWAPGTDVLVNSNTEVCYFTEALSLAETGAQYRFLIDNPAGEVASNTATVTVQAPVVPIITATTLASRATSGATANNRSGTPSLSSDGNIVAFTSEGTNLVPNFGGYPLASNNGYVRNLSTGVTTLVNQTPAGTQSQSPYGVIGLKVAAGGRHVIFSSLAGDLVADDTNGSQDVFVRDLQTGVTTRVSLKADGSQITNAGNGQSDMQLNISADGRYVSFVSGQDLIGDDPSGAYSLYFRDLQTGIPRRVFSGTSSIAAYSAMSNDGQHLAFFYSAYEPSERNFVVHYNAETNVTDEVFSIDSTNNASYVAQGIGISGNGRYIAFVVRSPTLLNGSNFTQVLAIDRNNPGQITVASGDSNGVGNGHSSWPKVSDDGHVLFVTDAGNLTGGYANSLNPAIVVRDLQSSALAVASRRPDGTPIGVPSSYAYHALSRDGTVVAFAADEFSMSGSGVREFQVYVAPRP